MNLKSLLIFACISFFFFFRTSAQQATIFGQVTDSNGLALEAVNIAVFGYPSGVSTDETGSFEINVPANEKITIAITHLGYTTLKKEFVLKENERRKYQVTLKNSPYELGIIEVEDKATRSSTMMRLDPKDMSTIPNPSGNIETMLKTLPGVSSNNELSAQYSVRGGNYDENLIYVNDILIYRPFLVRSGRQEGLSFINSSMVSSILFSSGGFEAKYGDKLSSVLDVRYKKPTEFGGSAEMSLLGGGLHLEGIAGKRITYIVGYRYRTNQYLLNSLETQGDYQPSFNDFQSYVTYDITKKWEIGLLTNYAKNNYLFVPENRTTSFGTIQQALQLRVFFDGKEISDYETYFGAVSNHYQPNDHLSIKFIASGFRSFEDERFDVQGQYFIGELERDLSKDNFGDVSFNRGVGTYLNHARNSLEATVLAFENKSAYRKNKYSIEWGLKYQHESIIDELSEWNIQDSSGFLVPKTPDFPGSPTQPEQQIFLRDVLRTPLTLNSNRTDGYVQYGQEWDNSVADYRLTAGIRANHWDLNNETVISPRMTISAEPRWERDYLFRFSTGYYYQPPFYRELRTFDGTLNKSIKAQRSIHFVLGADYNFEAWKRPFKFTGELYYKHLSNVIPYELENVRIRYYAKNNANAYAAGIDMKINGEFVKGVESWASLSVMQTQEDLTDDFYYEYYNDEGVKIVPGFTFNDTPVDSVKKEPGYIPRPTDQRVNFSLSFQDYLPRNPSYKVHVTLYFGTGLPFGPPSHNRYQDTLRLPAYRRVDIGFSKSILSENKKLASNHPLRHFKSIWLNVEVFNLLQINNTISHLWITDVTGRQYAVPNFLTSRRVNVKLQFNF
jgi:hypothetical protein